MHYPYTYIPTIFFDNNDNNFITDFLYFVLYELFSILTLTKTLYKILYFFFFFT